MRSAARVLFVALVLLIMGARCSCTKDEAKKSPDDAWINEETPLPEDSAPIDQRTAEASPPGNEPATSATPTPTPTVMEDLPGPEALGGDEDM